MILKIEDFGMILYTPWGGLNPHRKNLCKNLSPKRYYNTLFPQTPFFQNFLPPNKNVYVSALGISFDVTVSL